MKRRRWKRRSSLRKRCRTRVRTSSTRPRKRNWRTRRLRSRRFSGCGNCAVITKRFASFGFRKKQPSGCFFIAAQNGDACANTYAQARAKLHNEHALIRAFLRVTLNALAFPRDAQLAFRIAFMALRLCLIAPSHEGDLRYAYP